MEPAGDSAAMAEESSQRTGQVRQLAGSGSAGLTNGKASEARFNGPMCVTVDRQGNVIVADTSNHCIRKITPDGVVSTLAGSSWAGFTDGPAEKACFHSPLGVAVDSENNVIVADCANHLIRRVSPDGEVTTLAGNEWPGYADGHGMAASFHDPIGVALDNDDNVLVAEGGNDKLRRVTKDGHVTTLAGSGWAGYADGKGIASRFHNPMGVAVDNEGNIIVVDSDNHCLRKAMPDGTVTTLAGSGWAGFADGQGIAASFSFPHDVAVDGDGNAVVADGVADGSATSRLRKVTPEGVVTTLTNSGWAMLVDGHGTITSFGGTIGVAVGLDGSVIIADSDSHCIHRVAAGLEAAQRRVSLPQLPSTYEEDMRKMLADPAFADITFIVEGERIPGHRALLSARSEYFCTMLGSAFRESEPGSVVEVADSTAVAFKALLRFLYTDALDFSDEEVVHVMQLANQYSVQRAYNHCCRYCERHLSADNALPWLLQAHQYRLEDLRNAALLYVSKNIRKIRAGHSLQSLGEYPELMLELLQRV